MQPAVSTGTDQTETIQHCQSKACEGEMEGSKDYFLGPVRLLISMSRTSICPSFAFILNVSNAGCACGILTVPPTAGLGRSLPTTADELVRRVDLHCYNESTWRGNEAIMRTLPALGAPLGETESKPSRNFTIGKLVGARGFEPPTPCSRSRCATRLRYAPTVGGN